jgi:hypothetical protein
MPTSSAASMAARRMVLLVRTRHHAVRIVEETAAQVKHRLVPR